MKIFVSEIPDCCIYCIFCDTVADSVKVTTDKVEAWRESGYPYSSVKDFVTSAKLIGETRCTLLKQNFDGNSNVPHCERLENCPLVGISEVLNAYKK